MNNKSTIKKILIFLLVGVALLVGYSFINEGESGASSLESLTSVIQGTTNVNEKEVELANSEILRVLGSIQNIQLDDDIFSNAVFRDLRDTRFTIPQPLQIGRPNPFLPIGFDNVTIQTIQALQEEEEMEIEEELEIDPEAEFFEAGQEV